MKAKIRVNNDISNISLYNVHAAQQDHFRYGTLDCFLSNAEAQCLQAKH